MTIHPGFSGQSRFLTTCPGKKSQFSPDAHLSSFWLGVPDLSRFAHLCSRMFTHRWPKISSDFTCIYEKLAGGRSFAPDRVGGSHDARPDPRVKTPDGSRLWRSHPTIRAFGSRPLLRCSNYGHLKLNRCQLL